MWWKIRIIHFGGGKKIKCAWKNEEFHCIKLKKLQKKQILSRYFPKEYKIHEKLP
jgi:hypothetical protein